MTNEGQATGDEGHDRGLGNLPSTNQPRRGYEQPPELDDEDEQILDRIWDEIGREERDRREADRPQTRPGTDQASAKSASGTGEEEIV